MEDKTVITPQKTVAHILVCNNPEFLHPVSALPMPCEQVRNAEALCDLRGKGFEQAPPPKPALEVVK